MILNSCKRMIDSSPFILVRYRSRIIETRSVECKDKRTSQSSLSLSSPLLDRPPLTWIPVQTNRLALSQSARFAKQAQPARGYLRIPATPSSGFRLGSGSRFRLGWSPAVVYYATTAKCWQAILASTSLTRNYC